MASCKKLKNMDPCLEVKARARKRKSRGAPEIAGVQSFLLGICGKTEQHLTIESSSWGLTEMRGLQEDET